MSDDEIEQCWLAAEAEADAPETEWLLYGQKVAVAAQAAERLRISALVEAVREANYAAQYEGMFQLLRPEQERAWVALLAGLKGPNVANEPPP